MPMPTWNAWSEADSHGAGDLGAARTAGIDARERLPARLLDGGRAPAGESVRPASRSSSAELNCAATTAPIAATASRPATRAIALLMPEAMPALDSSASASTVAVSGATVSESPSENTSSAGRRSVA